MAKAPSGASRGGRAGLARRVLALASALIGLLGCQGAGARVEQVFYAEYRLLTFDRASDLIPPEGLRITSTEDRQVALSWDPVLVGDVDGYAILRARDAAASHVLIGQTRSRFASVYIDQGEGPERLGDGQTYSYRVHPFDSEGRVSRSHAHVTATTEPRPAAPSGLRAYSNLPRKVALAWDANPSRSVVGYAIYRSPTPSGEWRRVGFASGRLRTVWEDPVQGDLRVMYYRIEALNRFNAASDPTEAVQAVTKAEPLPPIGLALREVALGRIELGWEPNVENDLVRYEIWRADAAPAPPGAGETQTTIGPERRIGESTAEDRTFTDLAVRCGQRVRYRIRALDRDQLVGGFSQPVVAQGAEMGLELVTGPSGVPELVWSESLLAEWPGARIAEARGALPDRVLDSVEDTSRYALSALDPGPRTLRVTLLGPPAEGAPRRESPPCDLAIDLPGSPP